MWLWIIFSGWWLALFYLLAAVGMCMTVVFIPFGIKAFWFVMCVPIHQLCPMLRHKMGLAMKAGAVPLGPMLGCLCNVGLFHDCTG